MKPTKILTINGYFLLISGPNGSARLSDLVWYDTKTLSQRTKIGAKIDPKDLKRLSANRPDRTNRVSASELVQLVSSG